jgi:septal ring factor EnvC (AmiA/AmiB activator)
MTFVGKILVIVIMAFSLLFLGISTVVFTTSKNWLTATRDEQKKVDELKKKLQDAQAVSDAAKKGLEDAKASFEAETKTLTNRLASLDEQNKQHIEEETKARGELVSAQETAKSTLQEVSAKRDQTNLLRQQLQAV